MGVIVVGVMLMKMVVAPSYKLLASSHTAPFTCRTMSGTSVANPIVVASIALLLSSLPPLSDKRAAVSNVAAMKQIIMPTADLVEGFSMFEQGNISLCDITCFTLIQCTPAVMRRLVYLIIRNLLNCY
jgi:hypothetical protein